MVAEAALAPARLRFLRRQLHVQPACVSGPSAMPTRDPLCEAEVLALGAPLRRVPGPGRGPVGATLLPRVGDRAVDVLPEVCPVPFLLLAGLGRRGWPLAASRMEASFVQSMSFLKNVLVIVLLGSVLGFFQA